MSEAPGRFDTAHWPTELKLKQAERRLDIIFDDGTVFTLPAEYLRVESPSAEVQGHTPSQKKLVAGCAAIGIRRLEPVGNYAVRIVFDDGHDTGIYSWSYLYELGRDQPGKWQLYLDALAAAGLSRGTSHPAST
ncbi:MAG: DUF971 domain-containing protein [Aliidongia sp.]